MFSPVITSALSNLLYFALHIMNNGSFPKPLSAKEEQECLERCAAGDMEARNKLIEHNLRLIVHIIKKYYSSARDQDDLISIGTIGLIKAVSSYSGSKGTRFATYASKCIENEILMHFRSLKKSAQDVYISEPIDTDKDGNALSLMDIVADDLNVIEDVDMKMQWQKMLELIEIVLSPRERDIVKMRYGIGCEPLPQREVANRLEISRSYVSRIEKKALEKLKRRFEDGDNAHLPCGAKPSCRTRYE